jgi:hypothetical protein
VNIYLAAKKAWNLADLDASFNDLPLRVADAQGGGAMQGGGQGDRRGSVAQFQSGEQLLPLPI